MSFSFLQSFPVDVCHAIGGVLLVLDAGLVAMLVSYWKETRPPQPRRLRQSQRRPDDKVR